MLLAGIKGITREELVALILITGMDPEDFKRFHDQEISLRNQSHITGMAVSMTLYERANTFIRIDEEGTRMQNMVSSGGQDGGIRENDRVLHAKEGKQRGACYAEKNDGGCTRTGCPFTHHGKAGTGTRLCHSWRQTGTCSYGESCRFSHTGYTPREDAKTATGAIADTKGREEEGIVMPKREEANSGRRGQSNSRTGLETVTYVEEVHDDDDDNPNRDHALATLRPDDGAPIAIETEPSGYEVTGSSDEVPATDSNSAQQQAEVQQQEEFDSDQAADMELKLGAMYPEGKRYIAGSMADLCFREVLRGCPLPRVGIASNVGDGYCVNWKGERVAMIQHPNPPIKTFVRVLCRV
jgi:hypothetical protein